VLVLGVSVLSGVDPAPPCSPGLESACLYVWPHALPLPLATPAGPPPAPGSSGHATSGGAATGTPPPGGSAEPRVVNALPGLDLAAPADPAAPLGPSSACAAAARVLAAHVGGLEGTEGVLPAASVVVLGDVERSALPAPVARGRAGLIWLVGTPGGDRGPSRWCRMQGKQKMCPHVDICAATGGAASHRR